MSGTSWKAKGQGKPLDKAYVKKKRTEFNLEHDAKKSKYYKSEFLARRKKAQENTVARKSKLPGFKL